MSNDVISENFEKLVDVLEMEFTDAANFLKHRAGMELGANLRKLSDNTLNAIEYSKQAEILSAENTAYNQAVDDSLDKALGLLPKLHGMFIACDKEGDD